MEIQASGYWARAWWGEERLWKVWWLLGLPLGIATRIFNVAGIKYLEGNPALIVVGWAIFLAAYFAWCGIVWRCAPNVQNMLWKYIARIIIVIGLLRTVTEVLKMFQQS
jgi:hypothetical protein